MSGNRMNSVFYAESYHPIQAGSIDGTDILPHDNAVYRALLCSIAGLYDPLGDSKLIGDPYCTVFVGRLSPFTTEDTLRKAMSKYGRVKNLRLVRDVVTGASCGYAFVEYESEREMQRAYKDAQHSFIDDCEIIVDYNRQQLMPGWIPRRLGGGLGGKKESGQLRFGGRERPFRAPLRPIPFDDLKKLGIDPPPEGRYMSRFQVPSPPRRKRRHSDKEESSHRSNRTTSSVREEDYHNERSYKADHSRKRSSREKSYIDREETSRERSVERESYYRKRKRSSSLTEQHSEEHSHDTSKRRRSSKDDGNRDYRKHERQRPASRDCAES